MLCLWINWNYTSCKVALLSGVVCSVMVFIKVQCSNAQYHSGTKILFFFISALQYTALQFKALQDTAVKILMQHTAVQPYKAVQ